MKYYFRFSCTELQVITSTRHQLKTPSRAGYLVVKCPTHLKDWPSDCNGRHWDIQVSCLFPSSRNFFLVKIYWKDFCRSLAECSQENGTLCRVDSNMLYLLPSVRHIRHTSIWNSNELNFFLKSAPAVTPTQHPSTNRALRLGANGHAMRLIFIHTEVEQFWLCRRLTRLQHGTFELTLVIPCRSLEQILPNKPLGGRIRPVLLLQSLQQLISKKDHYMEVVWDLV